jgi:hypothetical protein
MQRLAICAYALDSEAIWGYLSARSSGNPAIYERVSHHPKSVGVGGPPRPGTFRTIREWRGFECRWENDSSQAVGHSTQRRLVSAQINTPHQGLAWAAFAARSIGRRNDALLSSGRVPIAAVARRWWGQRRRACTTRVCPSSSISRPLLHRDNHLHGSRSCVKTFQRISIAWTEADCIRLPTKDTGRRPDSNLRL